MPSTGYRLVRLANGAFCVRSLAVGETCHPSIGPAAEAEALYVRQLGLCERVRGHSGEFVIWDVGLGAAANPLTILRALRDMSCSLKIVSFDHTTEPLEFALAHTDALTYLHSYDERLKQLLAGRRVCFRDGAQSVEWELHLGDFPRLLTASLPRSVLPTPHAILFDPYSPAKNPAMWTQPLFAALHRHLDPQQPCALATFSRSTMTRVSLLLAGWFVGAGHGVGLKEETTIAANTLDLIAAPLAPRWLQRARCSTSAEPLWEPVYRQSRLSASSWEKLQQHPQFQPPGTHP